jgi:hypothetical protein
MWYYICLKHTQFNREEQGYGMEGFFGYFWRGIFRRIGG